MPPIHTPLLRWPLTADDKRVCGLPFIFTRISMIEKIENNIEGYFKSNSAPIDQTSTAHQHSVDVRRHENYVMSVQ